MGVKIVLEGRLFHLVEFEDRMLLITNCDRDEVLRVAGSDCQDKDGFVFCSSIEKTVEYLGIVLEKFVMQNKLHGKRVRITIEVID